MRKLHITVTKTLLSGKSQLRIEMDAVVTNQAGDDEAITEMLLEAEMHGNSGLARIHLDSAD